MKESLRYIRPFLRGLPIIIISVVITVMCIRKYLSYLTPKYESTVKVKLADIKKGLPNNNLFKDFDVFVSDNMIGGEMELMESSIILNRVIDQIGLDQELYRVGEINKTQLYGNSPILIDPIELSHYTNEAFVIDVVSPTTYTIHIENSDKKIKAQFGDTIQVDAGILCVTKNTPLLTAKPTMDLVGLYEYTMLSSSETLKKVKENIIIATPEEDVPIIAIIYRSNSPQLSADVVNTVAQVYIADYIETKFKAAETTVSFLDERINEVAKDLRQSENSIESYKNNKGIVDLRQESETDLRKIAQLKIQLSNIKISLDAIQELENNLKSNNDNFLLMAPNFQTYTDLLSTELVKKVKALQAEKKDLLLVYTPQNEKVKVIDRKLEDLKVYLIEGVSNSKKNLKTKYRNLVDEISGAEEFFEGFATKQKDLTVLDRDFNIYAKSYNFLTEKRIEAEIAKAAKISFHRVISPAQPRLKPVAPNKTLITIVAALLALIGSMVCIQVYHSMKGRVNDGITIESQTEIPIAIKTPFLNSNLAIKKHFIREAIQLELKEMIYPGVRICLSSNTNREGRQFHVRELARAFGRQDRRVLVLDMMDLIYANDLNIKSMSRESYRNMSKDILDAHIKQISEGYELVLIDNEPFNDESLGLLMMSLSDHNLYVMDSRRTPASHITEVDLMCEEFKITNLHFILNKDLYNPTLLSTAARLLKSNKAPYKRTKLSTQPAT